MIAGTCNKYSKHTHKQTNKETNKQKKPPCNQQLFILNAHRRHLSRQPYSIIRKSFICL